MAGNGCSVAGGNSTSYFKHTGPEPKRYTGILRLYTEGGPLEIKGGINETNRCFITVGGVRRHISEIDSSTFRDDTIGD